MKPLNKTLRLLCILSLLSGGVLAQAQELKERKLRTLSSLGLQYQDYNMADEKINADFRKILKLEKRRRSQKIKACIFLPVGVAATGLGISMMSNKKNYHRRGYGDPNGSDLEEDSSLSLVNALGVVVFAVGTAHIGVSIPMFVGSGSKKRQRDRLLSEYGVGHEGN